MSTHVIDVRGETAVSAETWRDARYVTVAAPNAYFLHLTAEQAEELAAGLITHVNALREPLSSSFRLPDGTWRCTRDGVTEPCGDCDGCRQVAAENAIRDAMAEAQQHPGRVVTIYDEGGILPPGTNLGAGATTDDGFPACKRCGEPLTTGQVVAAISAALAKTQG